MFKIWPSLKQYKSWSMPSKLTFISAYFGIFSLIFTLATYFASDEILKILKNPPERIWLEGRWSGESSSPNNGYLLEIVHQSKNAFRFKINSNIGAHTCEIQGIAKVKRDSNATYEASDEYDEYSDGICTVSFDLTDNEPLQYNITSDNCRSSCGLNGTFDALYIKENEYFIESGIVDEINISNFYKTVGYNYSEFRDSMDLISQAEDLDSVDAKVYSGGVRGLFTIKEGIIMQNSNGDIWAAVLVEDFDEPDKTVVKYFTNRTDYYSKLPKTIKSWSSRFSSYEVIYVSTEADS